jgi:hypothetical protein
MNDNGHLVKPFHLYLGPAPSLLPIWSLTQRRLTLFLKSSYLGGLTSTVAAGDLRNVESPLSIITLAAMLGIRGTPLSV